MGWSLPKPWENGYSVVTEQRKGTTGPGQDKKVRVWRKSGGPVPTPPVNTAAPVASGLLTAGSVLSVTAGSWSNSPTSYSYQWLRAGVVIIGATSSTYTTVSGDVGTIISCRVTATNADGSASAVSNALGPITAAVVTFSDTFAGAAGTDLETRPGWTKIDGGRQARLTGSNSLSHIFGTGSDSAFVAPDLGTPWHFVQAVVQTVANSTTFIIAGRIINSRNYCAIRRNANTLQLYQTIEGTFTQLATSPTLPAIGDTIRMTFKDNGVVFTLNGVQLFDPAAPTAISPELAAATRTGHIVRATLTPVVSDFLTEGIV